MYLRYNILGLPNEKYSVSHLVYFPLHIHFTCIMRFIIHSLNNSFFCAFYRFCASICTNLYCFRDYICCYLILS